MLRELSGVQQIKGEPMRRWFYDHEIDLVIWQDDAGEIISFQLAYDKTLNEHSLFWHRERGTKHDVVDDGEGEGLSKRTPFLNLNRAADCDRVLAKFLTLSGGIQHEITNFVATQLREMSAT